MGDKNHKESKGYEEAHKEYINKYKMAHCIGVAEYMRDYAYKYGLDGNQMYALGLLHDIGYLEGRRGHEQTGCEILSGLGVKEEFRRAVMLHGTSPYKLPETDRNNPLLVLLYEADMSVNARGYRVGFDKRLEDIGRRYGYEDIAYKTAYETVQFVKDYLENKNITTVNKYVEKPDYSRNSRNRFEKRQNDMKEY